jgi:hypothetical protein
LIYQSLKPRQGWNGSSKHLLSRNQNEQNSICQKVDAQFCIMKLSFFSASENIIHQLKSSDHFGGTSTLAISQQIL